MYLLLYSLGSLLCLSASFLLKEQTALIGFIVLGQAHFFLAYESQIRRGKITWLYTFIFSLLFLFLFSSAAIFGKDIWFFNVVAVTTLALFIYHNTKDGFFLLSVKNQKPHEYLVHQLCLYLAFMPYALISIFNLQDNYQYQIVTWAAYGISLFFFLWSAFREKYNREIFCYHLLLILGAGALIFSSASTPSLFFFIIASHCLNWYLFTIKNSLDHVGSKKALQTTLWFVNINVVIILAYVLLPQKSIVFKYFFLPVYYYIWAILHITLSFIAQLQSKK